MPIQVAHTNLKEVAVYGFNPAAGTSTGSRVCIVAPVRGQVLEAGFVPASNVTSQMTLAVSIGSQIDSQNSNFTQCVTSTLGTFASQVCFEGAPCSIAPLSPTFCNAGDAIQFTTSGGQSAGLGAAVYAIVRRM